MTENKSFCDGCRHAHVCALRSDFEQIENMIKNQTVSIGLAQVSLPTLKWLVIDIKCQHCDKTSSIKGMLKMTKNKLVDSGERTTFKSGAMRELTEDKGRCDLLPLGIICKLFSNDVILGEINEYICRGETASLETAILKFIQLAYDNKETAILELAKHYQDGAKKYADRNWEKGLPVHSFIDSGVRHYLKYLRGDQDEPHGRAFLWNMFGALWTQQNHPPCVDLPFADANSKEPSDNVMWKIRNDAYGK